MSTLTTEERDALKDTDFVFGDERAFPITDAADVKKAVASWGRYRGTHTFAEFKERLTTLATHKGFADALPTVWTDKAAMSRDDVVVFEGDVDMSDDVTFEGDMAIRCTRLFKAGAYSDKDFAITSDELTDSAVMFNARNVPVFGNHEHRPSIFDGELGELRATFTDGEWLWGKHAFPRWLNDILTRHPERGKFSIEFHRKSKDIVGYAHTLTPRVREAALAAFSAAQAKDTHMTDTQQQNADPFATALAELVRGVDSAKATFAGATLSRDTKAKLKSAHDTLTSVAPDMCAGKANMSNEPEMPPEIAAKFAQQEAVIREMQRVNREREAVVFADGEIAAKRLLPAEREKTIALFTQMMEDDQAHGVVAFSDGTQRNRTDMLKALFALRQPHGLTEALVPGATYFTQGASASQDGGTRSENDEWAAFENDVRAWGEKRNAGAKGGK